MTTQTLRFGFLQTYVVISWGLGILSHVVVCWACIGTTSQFAIIVAWSPLYMPTSSQQILFVFILGLVLRQKLALSLQLLQMLSLPASAFQVPVSQMYTTWPCLWVAISPLKVLEFICGCGPSMWSGVSLWFWYSELLWLMMLTMLFFGGGTFSCLDCCLFIFLTQL